MESIIPTQTLSDDILHKQAHLKEAVSLVFQQDTNMLIVSRKEAVSLTILQDTDMVIVSKDKKLIPCHSSLLALFSPVVARLLSGVPCCLSPTIFLPDFPALPIKKLLHLLRSGQAIPGENVNVDIKMINTVAQVLEISMFDLNLGPYLENPLEVSFEIKKELNNFIVKEEIISFEEEKKDKVLHVKQESDSCNEKLKSIPVKREEIKEYEYIEQDETEVGNTDFLNEDSDMKHNEEQDLAPDDEAFSVNRKGRQVCSVCGKSFSKMNRLKQHMSIHSGENLFSCEHCPKKFTTKSHLVEHTRIHTGERIFLCEHCPQKCTRSDHFKQHMLIHSGERPFLCEHCPKKFTTKSGLDRHTRIHTGEKPFSCLSCPQKFTRKSILVEHTRIHTGEKPFLCEHCTKKFTQKSQLLQHTRIHTGVKPFSCLICPQKFTQSIHLKNHTRSIHREEPLQCLVCKKRFTQKSKLKAHKKKCS